MDFFDIITEKSKKKVASLVLYCLLDRTPTIVFGNEAMEVDSFINMLSELIHFRKDWAFSTDIVSKQDCIDLFNKENIDYNYERIQIRCLSNAATRALSQIDNFESWLLGFVITGENGLEKKEKVIEIIQNSSKYLLIITIKPNKLSVSIEGIDLKAIDLSLEQNILQKVIDDTEKSVAKMKRVVIDKMATTNINKRLVKTLLNFEEEENILKKNIFRREIQNFYSGSKRAFFILSRLNLLNNVGIQTSIGSKTLLETIDYQEAPIERIISFIQKEWTEDYSILIEDGKKSFMGDKIVSLWG